MKKLLIIVLPFMLVACGTTGALSKSYRLYEGMTMDEVVNLMGEPCASELSKGVTEWHYCTTGINADEFVAVFFKEGKLIAVKNYTVTLQDTGGVSGSCRKFIKRGTYREPDVVVAIRSRYGD